MKFSVEILLALVACIACAAAEREKWNDIHENCIEAVRKQIHREVDASLKYLAIGAHFSRDTVNRPGFAKFFFDSASEEREHAIKLIEYLSMRGGAEVGRRGQQIVELPAAQTLEENLALVTREKDDGLAALQRALAMEMAVTESIRGVIKTCEGDDNDYHIVDWLTSEYLEEQHKAERELAGRISTLKKMMAQHGELGEFLYDKKFLE